MNLKNNLFKEANKKLQKEELTLCLYDGNQFYSSKKRGIEPLVELLNTKLDYSSFISVDKVIGKAAAFLYVALNIKNIYCYVISKPALEVFNKYHINVIYDNLVPNIMNRTKTGFCPMETKVLNINELDEALEVLYNK